MNFHTDIESQVLLNERHRFALYFLFKKANSSNILIELAFQGNDKA